MKYLTEPCAGNLNKTCWDKGREEKQTGDSVSVVCTRHIRQLRVGSFMWPPVHARQADRDLATLSPLSHVLPAAYC